MAAASTPPPLLNNKSGFVLVMALLILLVLIVIGISTTKDAQIDLLVAGNDKISKQTFYEAEGGLNLASELLEQNISCTQGFGSINLDTNGDGNNDYYFLGNDAANSGNDSAILGYNPTQRIKVTNLDFWNNYQVQAVEPSDTARDFFYPYNYTANAPHSNFTAGGDVNFNKGGAMQMAAGYEGVGKSAATGGSNIFYNIYSQRIGNNNSQSLLLIQWRHIVGQEEDCRYAP